MDVANAYAMALSEYGCTHTSADLTNIWVSQNLWRDFVASYLGVSLPDNSSRYFALQELMNTGTLIKGFIDTYFANNLCFYPRGVTSIGYLLSLCGLQVNRQKGVVRLKQHAPYPCRIPLLPLAEWRDGVIPFVVYELKDGEVKGRIIGEQALVGLRVEWI